MHIMIVKVKRLHDKAILPRYNSPGDSGMDLYTPEGFHIPPGGSGTIGLGIAMQLPEGYELQVRPTSGNSSKTKLRVTLGTVDNPYRGEIGVIIDNIGKDIITFERGRKIAQGVLVKAPQAEIVEVDELDESIRGEKGFGSSDMILGHKVVSK